MSESWHFSSKSMFGGLLTGVMYSLVALGFVLIYKASGVFNFAQGAMVLLRWRAALRPSGATPHWAATASSWLAARRRRRGDGLLVAWAVSASCCAAGEPAAITLFMATLGLAFVLEGLGQTCGARDLLGLDVGMPKDEPLKASSRAAC
jgi:branched-chain amino acid transport system permease protein